MDITLTIIQEEDLDWARKLRNENRQYYFDNKYIGKEAMELWYRGLYYPFYVIRCNGVKAGTISVRRVLNRFELHNILIAKRWRRKGLLRYVINLIAEKFDKPLYLDVLVSNKNAIIAYKKLGFKHITYKMKLE